jgi:hypothetical protein
MGYKLPADENPFHRKAVTTLLFTSILGVSPSLPSTVFAIPCYFPYFSLNQYWAIR